MKFKKIINCGLIGVMCILPVSALVVNAYESDTPESLISSYNLAENDKYYSVKNAKDEFMKDILSQLKLDNNYTDMSKFLTRVKEKDSGWTEIKTFEYEKQEQPKEDTTKKDPNNLSLVLNSTSSEVKQLATDKDSATNLKKLTENACTQIQAKANEDKIVLLFIQNKDNIDMYIVRKNLENKNNNILYTTTVSTQNWDNLKTKYSELITNSDNSFCYYIDLPRNYAFPLDNFKSRIVTSPSGMRTHPISGQAGSMHTGVDYSGRTGDNVYATEDGIVKVADASGKTMGGAYWVEIEHPDGYSTKYLHLSQVFAKVGARVKAGECIGRVGSTGISTGPHLHFEYNHNGQFLVPEKYIEMLKSKVK